MFWRRKKRNHIYTTTENGSGGDFSGGFFPEEENVAEEDGQTIKMDIPPAPMEQAGDENAQAPAYAVQYSDMPQALPLTEGTAENTAGDAAPPLENATDGDGVVELFPSKEESEEDEKQKYLYRRIGVCALAVMIIGFAVFCALMFRVAEIEVSGNEDIPSQLIIQTAGIEYGAHLLLLPVSTGEEKLRANPYIAEADIKREYPDRVKITIVERQEAAAIIGLSAVAIIDADGYVLSIGEREDYTELLKIYGAGASGYQVNGHIGDVADYSSRALSLVIAAVKESGLQQMIESADISNALSMTMITKSGITVNLGQAEDLADKLNKLAIVLPEVEKMGYTDGTISVYSHGAPVYSPYVAPVIAVAEEGDDGENEYTYVPSDQDAAAGSSGAVGRSDTDEGAKNEAGKEAD